MARKTLSIKAAAQREPETIRAEIAQRERELRKSEGKPGFSARCEALRARIAELNDELAAANE